MQNLVRYRPAGTYFARFKIGGRPVWKSLKTTVFSVAKQRLPDTIREHRAKLESVAAVAIGKMTVGNAAQVYLEKVRANVSLKPRSKQYRELMIDFIRRSWPTLFEMDVRKINERDFQTWLARFQKRYAPSVVNNGIGTSSIVTWDAASASVYDSSLFCHSFCECRSRLSPEQLSRRETIEALPILRSLLIRDAFGRHRAPSSGITIYQRMGISPSLKDRIRAGHVAANLGECAVIALFVEKYGGSLGR